MTSINVSVCEARAIAERTGKLTEGMVGVSVSFSFDEAWDELDKTAVFRCGNVTRDRSLILSNETTVPHEVLHKAEERLMIGVEGRRKDGTLVIPTTWADAGLVLPGANATGANGKDPTPNAYDDIMAAIQSGILRGPEGPKGDKPIKGVDYYTPAEQADLITAVLNAADAAVGTSPAVVCEGAGELVSLKDASDWPLKDLHIYGRTTQEGTPTPDAPVDIMNAGDSGNICVTIAGKNMFGGDALAVEIKSRGGTMNEETGIVSFFPGDIDNRLRPIFDKFNENTQYTFVLYGHNSVEAGCTNLLLRYADGTIDYLFFNNGVVNNNCQPKEFGYAIATSKPGKTVSGFGFTYANGVTTLQYEKCGIFEGAIILNDFEAYNGQAITVSTPNGLPGIPVTSGGNYTDEGGQQWISDEIDFARGVYTKRVGLKVFNTADGWKVSEYGDKYLFYFQLSNNHPEDCAIYCNIAKGVSFDDRASVLDNFCYLYDKGSMLFVVTNKATTLDEFASLLSVTPLEVVYIAEASVETTLSAAEIEAFRVLHSYKPNTSAYTDCNAGVKLEYIADTKTYIDNKFAELAAAIVANT